MAEGLGRRIPQDFEHVEKYPLRSLALEVPKTIERQMLLPSWHRSHNQGHEGACEGFGNSMMMSVTNIHQDLKAGKKNPNPRYNPWWLWDRAKEIDAFPDTNPGDSNGTTGRAACEILKNVGHVKWVNVDDKKSISDPDLACGISAYRWATTVDDIRAAINNGLAVALGVNWYTNFDRPIYYNGEYWVGKETNLGTIRGGHCVCIYGASDHRQAVKIKNSWGKSYPEIWMPYDKLIKLLNEQGEACVITDR